MPHDSFAADLQFVEGEDEDDEEEEEEEPQLVEHPELDVEAAAAAGEGDDVEDSGDAFLPRGAGTGLPAADGIDGDADDVELAGSKRRRGGAAQSGGRKSSKPAPAAPPPRRRDRPVVEIEYEDDGPERGTSRVAAGGGAW